MMVLLIRVALGSSWINGSAGHGMDANERWAAHSSAEM
jgi:hypothetical protein